MNNTLCSFTKDLFLDTQGPIYAFFVDKDSRPGLCQKPLALAMLIVQTSLMSFNKILRKVAYMLPLKLQASLRGHDLVRKH